MSHTLYLRIVQAIEQHDNYFEQKSDRVGHLGLSSLQKITATFLCLVIEYPLISWINTFVLVKVLS
jgi:hypothetical protein